MFEKGSSLEVHKSYEELKKILLGNKCEIVAEEKPKRITVKQGSLWKVTPKGVKKKVDFYLTPKGSGTRISSISSLTLDWIGVSILGYLLAAILAFMFWWLAIDLEVYIARSGGILWGWLAEALGYNISQQSFLFANLLRVLSTVSFIVIIYLIIADIYISIRKDSFAKQTLKLLP